MLTSRTWNFKRPIHYPYVQAGQNLFRLAPKQVCLLLAHASQITALLDRLNVRQNRRNNCFKQTVQNS
jgi:hypothetical protein